MGKKEADRAKAQLRERLEVTRRAFAEADRVIAAEIATVPVTCREGCGHCCRQKVTLSRAEAEAAVDWIKANWDADRIAAFGEALKAWLAWYRGEYPKLLAAGVPHDKAVYEHGPLCPALVDNRCSIYPARPIACRAVYVTSPADACRQSSDPEFDRTATVVPVQSLLRLVQPSYMSIRVAVEKQGADYLASAHLLPEWLAHLLRVEDQPWRTTPAQFG